MCPIQVEYDNCIDSVCDFGCLVPVPVFYWFLVNKQKKKKDLTVGPIVDATVSIGPSLCSKSERSGNGMLV